MISRVVKTSWTNPDGKMGFRYRVYHSAKEAWRGERCYQYGTHDNLPNTVLNFVLNATSCKTEYLKDSEFSAHKGLKRETYTNEPGL